MTDVKDLIRTERHALTDFLETLTPDEWVTQSLCDEWTVQDVAAHLAVAPSMSMGAGLVGLLRAGFRINRFNADSVRQGPGDPRAAAASTPRSSEAPTVSVGRVEA